MDKLHFATSYIHSARINYIIYMIFKIELPKDLMTEGIMREEYTIRLAKTSDSVNVVPTNTVSNSENNVSMTLGSFVELLVGQLRANNKVRVQETYTAALNRFLIFRGGHDIALTDIDSVIIEAFESRLRQDGLTLNTISFYMRVLRAIYNKAVRRLSIANLRPFDNVYTGFPRTVKRAVDAGIISVVLNCVPKNAEEALARDLFLFSFYTRGMSFVDIVNLRKSDVRNGQLVYIRQKTGQELRVAWRENMQAIVDRHPSLDGEHLLGVLNSHLDLSLRRQYLQQQNKVNYYLRRLSIRLALPKPLTMYVARHSWATIARGMHIPVSVISDSLGHDSEKTTQIYLKSIDEDIIDRTNDMLMAAIEKGGNSNSNLRAGDTRME